MSGLAQIMKNMGFKVQGSDQNRNKNTLAVLKSGIKFYRSFKRNVKSSTILVKSSAIKNNNSEVKFAKKKKFQSIQEQKY